MIAKRHMRRLILFVSPILGLLHLLVLWAILLKKHDPTRVTKALPALCLKKRWRAANQLNPLFPL